MKRAILMSLAAPLALGACMIIAEDREPARRVEVVQVERLVTQPAATDASVNTTNGVTIHRDVIYGHHDGMANVYDVIKPANANGSAVLYMVSGGWVSRWAAPETRVNQFKPLLDKGITVIPVHHGSAPRFKVPEAHADVKRALRHVSLNASSYGIDAKRLGVFGGSAGGHLSLMLGLNGDDGDPAATDPVLRGPSRIKAVVAYYPPVDLRRMTGPSDRFPALDFPNDQAAGISPILFVDAKDPATLIVHGDADELVPLASGQSIHDALKAASVKTNMVIIKGGDHGFSEPTHRAEAYAAMASWFAENL
jgi:acetyl esterase/lipase